MRFRAYIALVLLAGTCVTDASAASYHAILCGSGGDAVYEARFSDWGERLRTALSEKLYVAEGRVTLMKAIVVDERGGEEGADAGNKESSTEESGYIPTNIDAIRALFSDYAQRLTEEDDLFLYFIGHGSYIKRQSKFNIPGPDLTAVELGELFDEISARRIIVVNALSRGAGFVNVLSGENRVICTATKSVEESNAPEFMEYFIQGLEDGSADQDRDDRISILEACQQASALTQGWYLKEGFIPTEHALIDDNGDRRGTRLPLGVGFEVATDGLELPGDLPSEGALAMQSFLKDYVFPSSASPMEIARYLKALEAVSSLKQQKSLMTVDEYYVELEALLVEAASANREIRERRIPVKQQI